MWLEIYHLGGVNAIRRILAGLRADAPVTTGELFVHHANHVLGRDLRPLAQRIGFVDAELTAEGAPPADPPPAAITPPGRRSRRLGPGPAAG